MQDFVRYWNILQEFTRFCKITLRFFTIFDIDIFLLQKFLVRFVRFCKIFQDSLRFYKIFLQIFSRFDSDISFFKLLTALNNSSLFQYWYILLPILIHHSKNVIPHSCNLDTFMSFSTQAIIFHTTKIIFQKSCPSVHRSVM